MQLAGEWFLCDDGISRPVIRGEVETARGTWEPCFFLVDTGADRTVLSAAILATRDLDMSAESGRIDGLGGVVDSVVLQTRIRFPTDGSGYAALRGEYAACINLEDLDMSVLGRDVMAMFAVIVDQPGDRVCLLSQKHRYVIQKL